MGACTRVTSGGRSWINHHHGCPGRFNIMLCTFWILEEEERQREEERRRHHPHGCPCPECCDDSYCEPDEDHEHRHERHHHRDHDRR